MSHSLNCSTYYVLHPGRLFSQKRHRLHTGAQVHLSSPTVQSLYLCVTVAECCNGNREKSSDRAHFFDTYMNKRSNRQNLRLTPALKSLNFAAL
jgi:hypothetical protein